MDTEATSTLPSADLVVIGSSMGGIAALLTLVSTLPADFPVPIVVAQHVDPHQPSHLVEILARKSTLPVELVESSAVMQPGHMYLVPANNHVTIVDGHVQILSDWSRRPMPSVDLLLTTAAAAYGERLIAVILTGSGSDGSVGGVAVKNSGGTVVVEDPRTARDPSMPTALPPTAVDYVVDLDHMSMLLYKLLNGTALDSDGASPGDLLRGILTQVSQRANIDFRPYKTSTILRRISRRMVATATNSLREYSDYLSSHPEEVRDLVSAFLIRVTQFFRDPEAFDFLRSDVLPELIERARSHGRVLRLWSAGCATGEEPYSLVMLLADILGPELPDWTIKVFATDLDNSSIEFARRGIYPENMLLNLPDSYRERFFSEGNGGCQINKDLRQLVIFGRQDLGRSSAFPRIDMVSCRNLLIYFTPDLQQRVFDLFSYSLRQGGYLFLGKAETTRPAKAEFVLINKKWRIYRADGGGGARALPIRTAPRAIDTPGPRREPRPIIQAEDDLNKDEIPLGNTGLTQLRNAQRLLMRFHPVGTVVLDRQYRLQLVNSAARRMLGLRESGADADFLHSARGLPYSRVREAIDRAFREMAVINLTDVAMENTLTGGGGFLHLQISPVLLDQGTPDMVMITITEVTEQVQQQRSFELMRAEQERLSADLREANDRLADLNRELMYANESLQVANEEMMLTQEELQAANEEFEATNEELQATNEELETSNEELQASNEELETTNDELIARTQELQEVSVTLGAERARLAQIVEIAPFYIMVLRGPQLTVEAYNPRYAGRLDSSDVLGRPLEAVYTTFWEFGAGFDVLALVREAIRRDAALTTPSMSAIRPGASEGERYLTYNIVPSHGADGRVDGAVIYTYDDTQQRAREMEDERERVGVMIQNTPQIALGLYDATSRKLLAASPRYLDLLVRPGDAPEGDPVGLTWDQLSRPELPLTDSTWFAAVLANHEPVHLDESPVEIAGESSIWDVSLVPVPDAKIADRVTYIVFTAIDITSQVRANEELLRLDRLRDEFLSSASHELRTPLVPLRGYTDMLARMIRRERENGEPLDSARLGEFVAEMSSALGRVQRLVDDLMNVARLQQGQMALDSRPVDLNELLEQTANDGRAAGGPPIDLQLPTTGAPLIVMGDPLRLYQVLLNLLTNARIHAANSPHIELRLRRLPPEDGAPVGVTEIEVQDYGPGIAPADQDQLFTRFYRARGDTPTGGLGLGLFIARTLIELQGGTITVASAPSEGSTFNIRLPLAQADPDTEINLEQPGVDERNTDNDQHEHD